MAFLCRILKARRLRSKWLNYQKEKELALIANEDESDFEFYRKKISLKYESKFQKGKLGRFLLRLKTLNTIESVVLKSFIGFVGGVILTYIFFVFFHIGVSFSLKVTTYLCGIAGIILCLGLAFSSKVRCYVLLLLPVFFSKQGRQALLAYALFLAFTGPGRNTMHNMGILSDSMTCGQEVVRRTLTQIIEMAKAPFRSIKETVQKINASIKEVIQSVNVFVMKIKRIIVSVLNVIKKAATWLGSIINFCNKKVGTPFQRCMKTFDDAIADCKAKLGVLDFLCHVVHIVKALCYTVKWLDFICLFTEFVSDKVVGLVKKKLREFTLQMKNLFYVSIEFSHYYSFETKPSNTTKAIAKTILQEFSKRVEKLRNIFSFFGFMFSLLFILVFFKVYYYRYKYLTSDRFDNMFISKYIIDLDLKRAEMDKETVLPLEPREKRKYAKPTAFRLLKEEKSRVAESMFLLTLTTFKVITFLVLDYSLFWVLLTIYEAGKDTVEEETENSKIGLHVEGGGILANFYKKLGKTFEVPGNPNSHLNALHCLPDPVEPDTGRYLQIGFLVALCWLLTLLEPYGLRLRNIVMSHYYPDRARERAVWLYNHILRSRGSFIRFARRQLRRTFQGGEPTEKVTLLQRLFDSFPILGAIFGRKKENACLICGAVETKDQPLKRCKTPDCVGRYCLKCFGNLQNICTICQHPIEYGDISDISEEVDSSEEDLYKKATDESSVYNESFSEDDNKFLTFKEMELRDRFQDVEANKAPEYVKLSDLYNDPAALRKRVKDVLRKRLETLEAQKKESATKKVSQIKKIKKKVQDLMQKLGEKTSDLSTGRKSATGSDGQSKGAKSRVSFNVDKYKKALKSKSKVDFKALKKDIKAKLDKITKKDTTPREVGSKNTSSKQESPKTHVDNVEAWPLLAKTRKGNSSSDDSDSFSPKRKALTYFFVEREREIDFYIPEPPEFDGTLI